MNISLKWIMVYTSFFKYINNKWVFFQMTLFTCLLDVNGIHLPSLVKNCILFLRGYKNECDKQIRRVETSFKIFKKIFYLLIGRRSWTWKFNKLCRVVLLITFDKSAIFKTGVTSAQWSKRLNLDFVTLGVDTILRPCHRESFDRRPVLDLCLIKLAICGEIYYLVATKTGSSWNRNNLHTISFIYAYKNIYGALVQSVLKNGKHIFQSW